MHIHLPPPHCYLGLVCEAQKQGTGLQSNSSEALTAPSLSAQKPILTLQFFQRRSYKSCISAVSSRLGCTRELNISVIMLSNASFRPSASNIFDITYFSHTDNALDFLNLVKPLNLASAMMFACRYFPIRTALLLTKANSHSATQLFSVLLFLIEVTRLHLFYTHNTQNATIRIAISDMMKKSEREDTLKMAAITDSCRTCTA